MDTYATTWLTVIDDDQGPSAAPARPDQLCMRSFIDQNGLGISHVWLAFDSTCAVALRT